MDSSDIGNNGDIAGNGGTGSASRNNNNAAIPLLTLRRALTSKGKNPEEVPTKDNDTASFWDSDDGMDTMGTTGRPEQWFDKLIRTFKIIATLSIVALVLGMPGITGYLLRTDNGIPILGINAITNTLSAETDLIRWSLWLITNWLLSVLFTALLNKVTSFSQDQSRISGSLSPYKYYLPIVLILGFGSLAFYILFSVKVIMYHGTVFKIILSLLCASVVLLCQKFLIYALSYNYYQSAFRERDKRKAFALTTLERLENSEPQRDSNSIYTDNEIDLSSTPISAVGDEGWSREREGWRWSKVYANGIRQQVSNRNSQVGMNGINEPPSPLQSPSQFQNPYMNHQQSPTHVSSKSHMTTVAIGKQSPEDKYSDQEAKRRARYIFRRISNTPRITRHTTINMSDFAPYYQNQDDSNKLKEAFLLFDNDGNGDITGQEMVETVKQIYQDCRDLAQSRQDLTKVVKKLDHVLWVLTALISLLISLMIFRVDLVSMLVPFASFIVALSFSFGSTARNMFESLVFIFSIHAYDVGDRVYIDNHSLVVTEIGILMTKFTRGDGQVIYVPNTTLQTKFIHNIRRSPPQSETIEVYVAHDTTLEQVDRLEAMLNAFLKRNNRDFRENMIVQHYAVENVNRLRLVMFLPYKSNWQDSMKRWVRRTKFIRALQESMKELKMSYSLPLARQEVDIISVSHTPILSTPAFSSTISPPPPPPPS